MVFSKKKKSRSDLGRLVLLSTSRADVCRATVYYSLGGHTKHQPILWPSKMPWSFPTVDKLPICDDSKIPLGRTENDGRTGCYVRTGFEGVRGSYYYYLNNIIISSRLVGIATAIRTYVQYSSLNAAGAPHTLIVEHQTTILLYVRVGES